MKLDIKTKIVCGSNVKPPNKVPKSLVSLLVVFGKYHNLSFVSNYQRIERKKLFLTLMGIIIGHQFRYSFEICCFSSFID